MNIVNLSNPNNIVSFCETSLDRQAMNAIIQEHKSVGLSDPALADNLKTGHYQAVLVSLWSERDRTRRLEWLESKANESHPVLMFELAVAKFVAAPTVETVNRVSIPLIKAAVFRVSQDAQCSKDPSVKNGDAGERMSMTYAARLGKLVQTTLKCSLEEVLKNHQDDRVTAIKSKVLETAKLSVSKDLPSPDWVGWHGLSVFIQGAPSMYPADQYKSIRDAYAYEMIKTIENNR
jgi:hypothetical protein